MNEVLTNLVLHINNRRSYVDHLFQGAAEVGAYLSSHPAISKVSFTGSVATGSKIMSAAAATIKHVTLELGGKSPIIVFEDSDLDDAVTGAMFGNTVSLIISNPHVVVIVIIIIIIISLLL